MRDGCSTTLIIIGIAKENEKKVTTFTNFALVGKRKNKARTSLYGFFIFAILIGVTDFLF